MIRWSYCQCESPISRPWGWSHRSLLEDEAFDKGRTEGNQSWGPWRRLLIECRAGPKETRNQVKVGLTRRE
jgi:hypothetical protein